MAWGGEIHRYVPYSVRFKPATFHATTRENSNMLLYPGEWRHSRTCLTLSGILAHSQGQGCGRKGPPFWPCADVCWLSVQPSIRVRRRLGTEEKNPSSAGNVIVLGQGGESWRVHFFYLQSPKCKRSVLFFLPVRWPHLLLLPPHFPHVGPLWHMGPTRNKGCSFIQAAICPHLPVNSICQELPLCGISGEASW